MSKCCSCGAGQEGFKKISNGIVQCVYCREDLAEDTKSSYGTRTATVEESAIARHEYLTEHDPKYSALNKHDQDDRLREELIRHNHDIQNLLSRGHKAVQESRNK